MATQNTSGLTLEGVLKVGYVWVCCWTWHSNWHQLANWLLLRFFVASSAPKLVLRIFDKSYEWHVFSHADLKRPYVTTKVWESVLWNSAAVVCLSVCLPRHCAHWLTDWHRLDMYNRSSAGNWNTVICNWREEQGSHRSEKARADEWSSSWQGCTILATHCC